MQTDRGTEYFNSTLWQLFTWNNMKHDGVTAAVVERLLETLKSCMWCYYTRRYVKCLSKLVESYNNTFHRSIGMTPVEASNPKNKKFFCNSCTVRGLQNHLQNLSWTTWFMSHAIAWHLINGTYRIGRSNTTGYLKLKTQNPRFTNFVICKMGF